jgi:hypothetical protein
MWEEIFQKLNNKGLNPFPIGQHVGLCTENYCVVREGQQSPSVSGNRAGSRLVEVILFVPIGSYIQADVYATAIRAALKELSAIRKTESETPWITDDEVEAYTSSIEYQILKKMEG